ncbi:S1 family peptidase [Arthrobacter sp. YAF16]|uniref:S1 family peptidase n=1 Tax=Arthrobacter sp. YAF16 TaxID=3233076 RepID=UPI003F905651
MKTPTYALVIRAAAAVAVALAGSSVAVPALAEAGSPNPATASPSPSPSPTSEAALAPTAPVEPAASSPEPGISDAGLAEAIRRDLGMTLAEFNAAGAQAKRAAEAAPSLRGLPGYVGIVLRDGKIVVEGSGVELQARIDELNQAGPAEFALEAPALKTSALAAPTGPGATPAAAVKPELVAGSAEQLFQAYVREVGPAGLQAVAYADGHFIVRTGGTNTAEAWTSAALAPGSLDPAPAPAPGKISAAAFVSRYANVKLEKGAPIKTEDDYFGGQGYVIDKMTICSAGFGAFDPAGLPLVLTAGHCAEDGTAAKADVEPPTAAPAGGATTSLPAVLEPLGSFGFSQFGGPDNSPITGAESSPGNIGTDIAVIKDLRPGLKVQPSATTWKTPANPGQTSVKIIGTAAPYQGQAVCRSGRTTGWSCGEVAETGVYVVGGRTTAAGDLRAFKGFLSYDVQSSGGDSGGPWISGNFAVGTHSAGEPRGAAQNFAVATTLDDALGSIPGPVQLQLFLNKPELAGTPDTGTVLPGSLIRGRVPAAPASGVAANSTVRLLRPDQDAVEIPVDAAGSWSFNAPASEGTFQFTAETVNGHSRSGAAAFSLKVSGLLAPEISAPASGSSLAALDRVEGTGTPGNTVVLSGQLTGSAKVSPQGRWSVSVGSQRVYGKLSVSAVQTAPGHVDSPPATLVFTVPPPAPAVAGQWNGVSFRQDLLPDAISGTGVDGAAVTVLIDGQPIGAVQKGGSGVGTKSVFPSLVPHVLVAGGRWSVRFPAGLAVGLHTLSVTQSVDGIASSPLRARFTISPPASAAMAGNIPPTAAAGARVSTPQQPGSPAMLASTGANGVLPAAALAAAALLLGGACIALGRRRTVR